MNNLNDIDLASFIDHTFLKADGSPDLIEKLCEEAKEYGLVGTIITSAADLE